MRANLNDEQLARAAGGEAIFLAPRVKRGGLRYLRAARRGVFGWWKRRTGHRTPIVPVS
jgi:hypothetical protein